MKLRHPIAVLAFGMATLAAFVYATSGAGLHPSKGTDAPTLAAEGRHVDDARNHSSAESAPALVSDARSPAPQKADELKPTPAPKKDDVTSARVRPNKKLLEAQYATLTYGQLLAAVSETAQWENIGAPSAANAMVKLVKSGEVDAETLRADLKGDCNSAVKHALALACVKLKMGDEHLLPAVGGDLVGVYQTATDQQLKDIILLNMPHVDHETSGTLTLAVAAQALGAYVPGQEDGLQRTAARALSYLYAVEPMRKPDIRSALMGVIEREDMSDGAWGLACEALWTVDLPALEDLGVRNERVGRFVQAMRENGGPFNISPVDVPPVEGR